ncbi:hypothetical protein O181_031619 [Austropuccinia psidii MF-1]|uniref:Reverse transcriptase Ty1/copia-type domain-containing protein n=1 Tax=Austropuccinia psidii MF-1 TaxID=1389203 RepID=A0A9Q3H6R0_9BASI|nr:hypothetical protein [Austropuccinia psidii MF-1]
MYPGTGNVEITHHVKFLPNEFPSIKPKSTSTNHKSFVLGPNPTDTIPIESSSAFQNQTNDSKIPITQENPSTKQSLSNEEPIAAQIALTVHKGYSWVTEKESIPQKAFFGDVGNPGNILTHQRRPRHHANLADHLSSDPKAYQEAVNQPNSQELKAAIKSELNNMTNHHVWTPITSDQNVKSLRTTCVFKWKTNEDGSLSKLKARLFVRGFSQKEGIDYTEVFSPTGRLSSL